MANHVAIVTVPWFIIMQRRWALLLVVVLLASTASAASTVEDDTRPFLIRYLDKFTSGVNSFSLLERIAARYDASISRDALPGQGNPSVPPTDLRRSARSTDDEEERFAIDAIAGNSAQCTFRGEYNATMYSCGGVTDPVPAADFAVGNYTLCTSCGAGNAPCLSTCCNATTFACSCNAGFSGARCETAAGFKCTLTPASPAWLPCAKEYRGGARDPSCPLVSISQYLDVEYRLTCVPSSGNTTLFAAQIDGTPAAYAQKRLQLHVIKLTRLTDRTLIVTQSIGNSSYWTGEQTIAFRVPIPDAVAMGAVSGGRLYFEVGTLLARNWSVVFLTNGRPQGLRTARPSLGSRTALSTANTWTFRTFP